MTIKIGEKIKLLRREINVTQDKLAEYLGVTPQAISRWESGNCYPDIEILPSIASFFSITTDELLGYNASINEQEEIAVKIHQLIAKGRFSDGMAEARRALALYPQNHGIAIVLASQIFAEGSTKDTSLLDEAIALCQRVLRDCTGGNDGNDIIRLSAKKILIHSLCIRERRDEASQIALSMPSIVMGLEFIRQTVLKGNDRVNYSLSVLPIIITMLTSSFLNNMAHHESEKAKPIFQYNSDECLRDIAIWDTIYSSIDSAIRKKEKESCWVYMFLHLRLARTLIEQDKKNDALKHFQYAVNCIQYIDSGYSHFAYNLTQRNKVIELDTLCKKGDYNGKSSAFVLLHGYIENGYFNGIEDESTFKECVVLLKDFNKTTGKE